MPFTPFHLGPGALLKAIGGDCFSFTIFAGAQVLIDVEPLVRMMRGDTVLHGASHTIAAALVIAMISTAVGRPLGEAALRHAAIDDRPIGWAVASISALIGTYSHVALDAVMHADIRPLWPIADGNGLLGLVSIGTLHAFCIVSGLLGGAFIAFRTWREA